MSRTIRLKKGLDIPLDGRAEKTLTVVADPEMYGVKPIDFPGLTPRLDVSSGDSVKAGSVLFHDKLRPEILFTSPVSGTVISVERGERRKILEVVIRKNGNDRVEFGKADPSALTSGRIMEMLLKSGLWPAIRQRPYHVIAKPGDKPKAVFISGFDTAPLAPDYNFIMENTPFSLFYTGIEAVKKLTEAKIHLVLNGNERVSPAFTECPGVDITFFSGPHPAGNVGVHIHHLDPLNKGETVWFINLQDVIAIGRLFTEGIYSPWRIVALTGPGVTNPRYYKMLSGSAVTNMLSDNIKEGSMRFISGNVLTGTKISGTGYLGFYDSQVTVIREGDHFEFLGWAVPGRRKYSFYRTFLSSIMPPSSYKIDTNLNGGERAFVVTGQYEKVVPMDIYPMQLFKAIMAEDIDLMENLGIYEIAEEDVALCEFICPSKTEIQAIVRKGLDLMIKELG